MMNRAERRARGYYKPVGLVPEGLVVDQDEQFPRYLRRHVLALNPFVPNTRRVRKARARIKRLLGRSFE